MMRTGLIEEMMEDAMDSAVDVDLEEETEAEVDKVLAELAGETAAQLASAPRAKVPVVQQAQEEEDDGELDELHQRLAAIKN